MVAGKHSEPGMVVEIIDQQKRLIGMGIMGIGEIAIRRFALGKQEIDGYFS